MWFDGAFFIFDFLPGCKYHVEYMKYLDSHCHIITDADISRAHAAGVDGFIVNSTRPDEWAHVVDIVARHADVRGAIGVHPWYAGNMPDGWDARMCEILRQYPNLMVGEVGLDKNHPDIAAQEYVFARQIDIAARLNRTLHIHCVGAWDRMRYILAHAGCKLPRMLFHSFAGSPEIMDELCAGYDAYFSFSDFISNPSHRRARMCVARVPRGRLLIESDGRGVDALILAANTAAQICNIAPDKMAAVLYKNAVDFINS